MPGVSNDGYWLPNCVEKSLKKGSTWDQLFWQWMTGTLLVIGAHDWRSSALFLALAGLLGGSLACKSVPSSSIPIENQKEPKKNQTGYEKNDSN